MLLKAYASWVADPTATGRVFAGQIAAHRERLNQYLADWDAVQRRHGGGPPPATDPDFGSYATLRFGIDYERNRIAWLEWMAEALAPEAFHLGSESAQRR
jgi:hypothetical protein